MAAQRTPRVSVSAPWSTPPEAAAAAEARNPPRRHPFARLRPPRDSAAFGSSLTLCPASAARPARDARTSGAWRVSRSATSPTRSTTARAAPLQPPAHATVERRSRPSSCTRRPSHQAHGMASSGGLTRWSGRGRISTRLIFCERSPPAEPSFVRESAMKTSTGGLRASIARAVVAAALTLGAACATLGTVPEQDAGADSAVESRVDATSGDARNGGTTHKDGGTRATVAGEARALPRARRASRAGRRATAAPASARPGRARWAALPRAPTVIPARAAPTARPTSA